MDQTFGLVVRRALDERGHESIRIFVGYGRWISITPQAAAELVATLNCEIASCLGNRRDDDRIPATLLANQQFFDAERNLLAVV